MSDAVELGMNAAISRRDFVGGMAGGDGAWRRGTARGRPDTGGRHPRAQSAAYPPLRDGLRGQYPGSFEAAHQLRDGSPS
ncbi:MAG: hypothetical protein ACKVZ0_12570 [Gemmatimonadales bacterium]